MPDFIARLLGISQEDRLQRLNRLAIEMDKLLITSKTLTPERRRQLEEGRQQLESQIRQLVAA